jgi:predicted dienelactone hydrolase
VVTAAAELHVRGPCGDLNSIVSAIFLDQAMDGQITVPVLLVYGDKDSSYPASAAQQQAGLYSSSPEVTTDIIHNAGHAFTLEYTAPSFRADIADWLARHTPPNPTPPPTPKPHGPLLVLGHRGIAISSGRAGVLADGG